MNCTTEPTVLGNKCAIAAQGTQPEKCGCSVPSDCKSFPACPGVTVPAYHNCIWNECCTDCYIGGKMATRVCHN